MSSRGILDSSPLRPGASEASRSGGPPKRKSLKRSASTASLLTPPRTVRRKDRYSRAKSRSKSRTSDRGADVDTESEGDDDDDEDEHQPVGRLNLGRKRQRTDRLEKVAAALTGEDAENPFWDGATKEKRGVTDAEVEDEDEEEHTDRERSPTPPLVRFKKNKAPVSPPPSRRRKTVTVAEPTTPKSKIRPVRDSPNNPFLDDSPSSVVDDASPKTPKEHEEKPEITYVFRGVRTTFTNPHYNLSPSARQRALLPVDHPDFSPDAACPPRMLFSSAKKRTRSASPTRKRTKASVALASTAKHKTDDEWDDDESTGLHLSPPKRLFQVP